jgi:hypothetical protein
VRASLGLNKPPVAGRVHVSTSNRSAAGVSFATAIVTQEGSPERLRIRIPPAKQHKVWYGITSYLNGDHEQVSVRWGEGEKYLGPAKVWSVGSEEEGWDIFIEPA